MALQLLRVNDLVGASVSEMAMMIVFGNLLGLGGLFLCLPLLEVFDGFQDIVLLHGDSFNLLNSDAFSEDDNPSEDGHEAAEGDPDACAPTRPVKPVPVPHPDAEENLENRVPHVQPDDSVEGPRSARWSAKTGQGGLRH